MTYMYSPEHASFQALVSFFQHLTIIQKTKDLETNRGNNHHTFTYLGVQMCAKEPKDKLAKALFITTYFKPCTMYSKPHL